MAAVQGMVRGGGPALVRDPRRAAVAGEGAAAAGRADAPRPRPVPLRGRPSPLVASVAPGSGGRAAGHPARRRAGGRGRHGRASRRAPTSWRCSWPAPAARRCALKIRARAGGRLARGAGAHGAPRAGRRRVRRARGADAGPRDRVRARYHLHERAHGRRPARGAGASWRAQGMQRLVLDLRDNGGGSVAEATRMASEFLPAGAIVYTSDGRKAERARHGWGAPLVLAARAALPHRGDGERGDGQRVGAAGGRAAGPRPRAHRGPAHVRQVAADAGLSAHRRVGDHDDHRPRQDAVRPRGAAPVPRRARARTTTAWPAPSATPWAVPAAARRAGAPCTAAAASTPTW